MLHRPVNADGLNQSLTRLSLSGDWSFRQLGDADWLPATVPGCNFTDLLANDVIPEPFYRDNELALQWVENVDWEYRRQFTLTQAQLDKADISLVAEGLDTFCDIYLNGVKIGAGKNMFVTQKIACKPHLKLGDNELHICFRSPINEAKPKFQQAGFVYPAENDKTDDKLSVYCRKAPCHFGWDWGPRFVTSGVWRDIYLEFVAEAKITQVHFHQQALSEECADFSFQVKLESCVDQAATLRVVCIEAPHLNTELPVSLTAAAELTESLIDIRLRLDKPELWWPNGLGAPFMYHFKFDLIGDAGLIDRTQQTVGFRTLEVINEPDEEGESFYLKVNGHPVFMKGANYIPADSFVHRVTPDRHKRFFDAVVHANMNMLRVWGGGVYQDDEFYRLADDNGILIWQDFMFACSLYPADDDFIDNVRLEAEQNVARLRNHPCIALWCGNNEVDMGIHTWDWPSKFDYSDALYERLKLDYMKLFDQCLRAVVSEHDPQRFYLRSSPISFWETGEDNIANHHYWGVWHGEEQFSEYQRRVPRFMSEYGFQSFPLRESFDRFADEGDLQLDSAVMTVHQKHPRGNHLVRKYMQDEFKEPKDFDALLYLSQVQQAEGLKLAFEAHRAAMPFCMGSLYWQLNDTWPAASWSSIDYFGRWKALQYQARRSFKPQLLVVNHDDDQVTVSLVSDALTATNGYLKVQLLCMRGQVLWSYEAEVVAPANHSARVFEVLTNELVSTHSMCDVLLLVTFEDQQGQVITETTYFFTPHYQLNLTPPTVNWHTKVEPEALSITLGTDVVARHVYLCTPGCDENFSDNFFDLLPNQEKTVKLVLPGKTADEIQAIAAGTSYLSLTDSYN